jgi:hypothetical protein
MNDGESLPLGLLKGGFVGKCYDISCFVSESEANKFVSDVIEFANPAWRISPSIRARSDCYASKYHASL